MVMRKNAPKSNLSASSARQEPYVKPASPTPAASNDSENIVPASASNSPSKPKHTKAMADPAIDWRDIELKTKVGEGPCYDDASTGRRKLNNLPPKRSGIPCQHRRTHDGPTGDSTVFLPSGPVPLGRDSWLDQSNTFNVHTLGNGIQHIFSIQRSSTPPCSASGNFSLSKHCSRTTMPTLGEYLDAIYLPKLHKRMKFVCGESVSSNDGAYRFKQDPELSTERTNVILVYRGTFNPPHRGHLAVLWHAYTQLAKDLNVIAAIVYPMSEERVKTKCAAYPRGERRVIPLSDRGRLWREDPNFPPWAWVNEHIDGGRHELEKRLKKLARKDGCRIRIADLWGPDCCGPDDQLNDRSEMRIVSDIAREADFDHQDGLEQFSRRGFGPWVLDNELAWCGSTCAETKDQMLSQWNELQRQQQIAAGEERARMAVAEKFNSVFDMSASIVHGASDLATAKVDGLLGLVGETADQPPAAPKADQEWLTKHLAGLGSPKSSSVCRLARAEYLKTLRFLRATPGQYAPFRGISSSIVQNLMRDLEGYKLLSALESVALSPKLLWDMLLPWALSRDGSDYEAHRGSPLQLEMEQDLMVPPARQVCLLEEDERESRTVDEVVTSIKRRDASPTVEPTRLRKRKWDFSDDTLIQSTGAQRLMRKFRKI
ncbi:MAG: hypothetical protein Q9173_005913 [Seirophora scorigena]